MNFRPIRTPDDFSMAKAGLGRLLKGNAHGDLDDEIEVLSILIEQYERENVCIGAPTPVAAIKFRMEELGLTARQLEPYIGSRARVSEVLSGKRSLSIDMIRSLHEGLAIPYESLIANRAKVENEEFGVSRPTLHRLNSFGFDLDKGDLSSFVRSSLPQRTPTALHRKTRTQRAALKIDQNALLLWQAAVQKKADEQNLQTEFVQDALTPEVFRRLALLSTKPTGPTKAIEKLNDLGIVVIYLPPLQGTYLDGAAMLREDGQPIIGLTLRHDRTDIFWFTLLHELAHIHFHYADLCRDRTAFVDDIEILSEDFQEREADQLARNSLIPEAVLQQVNWSEAATIDDIITVSSRARVHISVVAGRWQRDHQNYRKFARLIERNQLRAQLPFS